MPGALLIAAMFAVHPLHVASVAWIIERKDLLSALFYLGAVLAWLRFAEVERVGHYLLVVLLFAAGLLSKSVVGDAAFGTADRAVVAGWPCAACGSAACGAAGGDRGGDHGGGPGVLPETGAAGAGLHAGRADAR